MKRILLFSSILVLLCIGCKTSSENQTIEKKIKENILGDWERIYEDTNSIISAKTIRLFALPEGMTILNDSIEFYLDVQTAQNKNGTNESSINYFNNFIPYKISNDTIMINDPIDQNWKFKWKFKGKNKDTLQLAINDSTILKFKKITYNPDSLANFDQIILSTSGCYGDCPVYNISISKDGSFIFQGEESVTQTGVYSGKLDPKTVQYIFQKFEKANPLKLSDYYNIGATDCETISTTYIKNGIIVKTIQDYGKAAPNELIWAYSAFSKIQKYFKMDSLSIEKPFCSKDIYFSYKNSDYILTLEKSDCFYLWSELRKSKITNTFFHPIYKVTSILVFPNHDIKSITTDGQYYKFYYKKGISITYDLGYNFLDRNNMKNKFKISHIWIDSF
jgi:hypothetical protein